MAASYPRKQTVIIVLVCALAVVGSAWYVANGTARSGGKSLASNTNDSVRVVETGGGQRTGTDWQKQFFTSATSSIFRTSADIDAGTENSSESVEPDTVTGQFGKKFFERYMLLKQNDLTEDPEAVQAVIEDSMQNLLTAAPEARVYEIRETIPAASSDATAIRAYANTIGNILATNVPDGDAAIIATVALEEENKELMKDVETIAAAYNLILQKVLAVPVPAALTIEHINLINGLSAVAFVSDGMTKVFSDPIQGIVAVASYEKSIATLRDALLDYKYYFAQQGTTFSASESGSVFARIQ